MAWKTLDDMDLAGKTVLIRVDVNVPVENGRVTDSSRLDRIVPTVHHVLDAGGKPVLMGHFGRPDGFDIALSTQVVVPALSAALNRRVHHTTSTVGEIAAAAIATLPEGDVLLLENTRFHPGEKQNDTAFAAQLADLGDVFVSDAFSAAHRAHASVAGIADLLPACAGRLMTQEISALEGVLTNPQSPVLAVVGGAKVSSKLVLLENLIQPMDKIVIGGGMANTFLAARGHDVGKSLFEPDLLDTARTIMDQASAANCELILPIDVVAAAEFKAHADHVVVDADACPSDHMILDAGPKTADLICQHLKECKTIVWNGPLGAFELEPFNAATDQAARMAADLTRAGKLTSVAGGGDTVAALNSSGSADDFTYISTAGGAFLEWLEGKTLPGVAALRG